MNRTLIPQDWLDFVNKNHGSAQHLIEASDNPETLKDLYIRQLRNAELDLISAFDRLMQKYAHAKNLARAEEERIAAAPNIQLTSLLMQVGVQTEQYDEHE